MTAPLPSMPPKASPLKRWGPVIGIVVVVAIVGAIVVLGGSDDTTDTASGPGTGATETSAGGEVPDSLPITYDEAVEAGTVDDYTWPDNCDTETGRLMMPTVYAAPCVPVFEGDNGGATWQGVTEDTIKVAFYRAAENNDLLSTLQGKLDEPEDAMATRRAYLEMFTDLYETYGRRVELVEFQATGAADDETAAIADAREVAQDLGVFASIGGPVLTGAYAEELAKQGVLCFGCGAANPDAKYQENAPYWWGPQASAEQFLNIVSDFVGGQLLGKPAEFAGSEEIQGQERVFGVVHFEQEVPVFSEVEAEVAERGAERGYESALTETYTLDFAVMPERAQSIIAKMKEADVTTIIFLGDPIMPIYLTEAATAQDYYPEWILTGTVLTDTAALARLYDQDQWAHAFGLSSLPARAPREEGASWRLHTWYFGEEPQAPNTQAIIFGDVSMLMQGIQMAGPDLTPETFAAGMFRLPENGGGPTTPTISFGDHGHFANPDYLGIDDMTVVWWDVDEVGLDEQAVEATGMYRYVDGGKRYLPGEMEPGTVTLFDEEGTVLVYDEVPDEDVPPDYPSPEQGAGCPAVGCGTE